MRRDQLEHAIRTACQIIGHDAVVVVGSQAILGSFAEDEWEASPVRRARTRLAYGKRLTHSPLGSMCVHRADVH
jgi:hypothetical protein